MPLVPTLMLHHVFAGGGPEEVGAADVRHPDSYISLDELRRHLDRLQRWGYATPTLAEALQAKRLQRRAVVLTFDDGCSCFAEYAAPELHRRDQRATLFAVSGELGGSNRWDWAEGERREQLLDATALRALAEAGIEIGCHGRTHADLAATADERLADEVRLAKGELESACRRQVQTFCYPYGTLDRRARQSVVDAGYLGAVSIFGKPNASPTDRFALARMIVRPGESAFELRLKVAGLYPLWSRLPSLGLLRALRRPAPGVSP